VIFPLFVAQKREDHARSIIIATMEVTKAKHGPDQNWRQHIIDNVLPKMEATTEQLTGFQPATAADFGPITFRGDRTPNDPAVLLDGRPLEKLTWIDQRHADLLSQIPTFEQCKRCGSKQLATKIASLI
jgi:hypothetical protein